MKLHIQHFRRTLLPVMGVSMFVVSVALSGPTNTTAGASKTKAESGAKDKTGGTQTAKLEAAKSAFYIPKDQKELRTNKDPFFPRSQYPLTIMAQPIVTTTTTVPVVVTSAPDLTLSGLSGTEEKPYAIINFFTFGIGDERDVAVIPGKPKVKVRCVEIHLADQTVVVSVGGRLQTLSLKKK